MASRSRIGTLQFHPEGASEFGDQTVDHTAIDGSNSFFLHVYDLDFTPDQEALEDDVIRTSLTYVAPIPGSKAGNISFKVRMADEATLNPTTNFPIAKLLSYAWGEDTWVRTADTSKTILNGVTSTSIIQVADADNDEYAVGEGVVVKDTSTGSKEVRWVKTRSAGGGNTTITLNEALSFTPASGVDYVYGGHTVHPKDPIDNAISLYFKATFEETNECYEFFGCGASEASVTVENGFPTVSFTYRVAHWRRVNGASITSTRSWGYGTPIPYTFHAFYIGGTKHHILPGWSFNMGMELADIQTPQLNGIGAYEHSARTVTGNYSLRFDSTEFDKFANRTNLSLMMNGQEGVNAGNQQWGFYVPSAHLTALPSRASENGLNYLEFNYRAGDYTGDGTDVNSTARNTDARLFIATTD